ncbi:MAG: M55 family metallopeptidase [Anaerolineae bacterium]
MKILISADMEGITGVTTWPQVTPGHAEYGRFRSLMTADVNAAVRGAFAAGATDVVVSDGHWNGSNILVEELDPRARLNSGSPSPMSMMQGIDQGVNGVLFIGYHARQGSHLAVLDHTWSDTCVAGVWLNGAPAGEYTLNAGVAAHYGAPVLMASGDQTACAQMLEQLGPLETAVVKQATGRFSAECLPPEATCELIEQAARQGVQRLAAQSAPPPFLVRLPAELTVQLVSSDMADRASLIPGVTREGTRLTFTAPDMPQAYATFRALVLLSYPR